MSFTAQLHEFSQTIFPQPDLLECSNNIKNQSLLNKLFIYMTQYK